MKSKVIVMILSLLASSLGLAEIRDWQLQEVTREEELFVISGEVLTKEETVEEPTLEIIDVDSDMPYYIRINREQNVTTVYAKQEEGGYLPYKAMICSIGTATPASGEIHTVTNERYRWSWLSGGVYGQYVTNIVGGIYFHSVPYTQLSNNTLEYWEYDKLGTFASLGCVRLTVEDAKWVYENIEKGTKVEFYEDENPGPLGKPEAQKISDNEVYRNWDPTDDDVKNPWKVVENNG